MKSQIKTKGAFLSKLPASQLYKLQLEPYSHLSGKSVDWFTFLESTDVMCGRAGDNRSREFPYISYNRDNFKGLMLKHIKKSTHSFIDVGCGGGDKLAIVKKNWPYLLVHGVEHDPAMAIWARLYADEVFCTDAMNIDYGCYDLIYAYWPISQQDGMNKLIDHILNTKRARAMFILVGYHHCPKKYKKVEETYGKLIWK